MNRLVIASAACGLLVSSASAQLGVIFKNGGTVDQYIDVPYHATLVPQTGVTVEAWVTYDDNLTASGFLWPTICRQNLAPNSEAFVLRVDASNSQNRFIKFAVRTPLGFQTTGYNFLAGELKNWTHVAGTFDGTDIKIFINGVEKSKFSFSGKTTMRDTGGSLRIGNGDLSRVGAENWNGEIDEVRLWPYARTADEIQSTMKLAMNSIPGEVSTWNLDFTPRDSSFTNHGSNVGNPTYQANALRLTAANWTVSTFGTATAGCAGAPAIGATSTANIGNKAFGLTCVHAAKATGGIALLGAGVAKLPTPVSIGTAQLYINPLVILGAPIDEQGLSRFPMPIPNDTTLINLTGYFQEVFAQSGCAVQPYASAGLQLTITQ